jgi:23S rRNA pseudouridine2605 synthase
MSGEIENGKRHGTHRGRKFRGKRLKTALPRPAADVPPPQAKSGERIAKAIARAGLASRREAEAFIAAGRVAVNGAVISSPALNVRASDRIAVDGKPLPVRERTRLFLFHKPRGLVTTSADTHGRPTIFGALPKELPRLVSIGRLDLNTEGLLLLTNDGGLARALELPSTGWLRRYRVRAHGKIAQARLDELRGGIEVDGIRYGPIEATLDREQGANVWLTFAMREGKNREIRNVLRALGLAVNRLIRVSYGPFQLGELPPGAVEEVRTRALREQLGERIAAFAGADFSGPLIEREGAVQSPMTGKSPPRHSGAPAEARRARAGEPGIHNHRGRKKGKAGVMDSGPRAQARGRNDRKGWRAR